MMIRTYTVSEVSTILGLSDTGTRERIRDGRLRASWRGGRWNITEADLLEYINATQTETVIVPPQSREDVLRIIDRYGMQPVHLETGDTMYTTVLSSPCTELSLLTQGPVKLLPDGQRVDGMYIYKRGGGEDGADMYLYAVIFLDAEGGACDG